MESAAPVTPDIDLVGYATRAELDRTLGSFGFVRETGRHWWHEELEIAIEVPADELAPLGSAVAEIELRGGRTVRVIALEDLLCDRLEGWAATGDVQLYQQAARLEAHPHADRERLAQRVEALGRSDQLIAVRVLREHDRPDAPVTAAASQAARAAAARGATAGEVAAVLEAEPPA